MRSSRVPIFGLTLAAALALAGCGSGSSHAGPSGSPVAQDRLLKYTQCLRSHGIQVPDPNPADRKLQLPASAKSNPAKLNAAIQACRQFAGTDTSGQGDATNSDEEVKLARCLRQHGVNVADPQPGQGLQLPPHSASDPKIQKDIQACSRS